ncbi:hypothetical protein PsorP6_004035 [Peronosclerospora sorghi]|uniref:Uncharacterized protein n=1 Tax=Peronosclerospora sorghi TaxID=230839 RepID=A0ACC0VNE5_9STRA|nr:hypothetical protein PsorP6_004035 [Peronosclerospora sorghi]
MADSIQQGEGDHTPTFTQLAKSSVNRSPQIEDTYNDAEKELVRQKILKARERLGTSLADIPTGREYDSPPNVSDELAYDALEKAYNAAFLVRPATKTKNDDKDDDLARPKSLLGNDGTMKGGSLSSTKHNFDNNEPKDTKDSDSESKHLTGSDGKQITTLVSCSNVSGTTTPPQSPTSVSTGIRTSSEDGFVSTPEAKKAPYDVALKPKRVEDTRRQRADHLSLIEFLISELEVYCSRLLGRGCLKNRSSNVGDLARITGVQLYQDHLRALMDFDHEWKRSHANKYRSDFSTISEKPTVVAADVNTNPFQQDIATKYFGSSSWIALLNQVRASSTTSTPAGTLYLPEVNNLNGIEGLCAAYNRGSNGIIVGGDKGQEERLKASAFMAQIVSSQRTSALYVIVAASRDLEQWEKALLSEPLIQFYPYWGSKQDRQHLLQLLSNGYFSSRNLWAHVLVTSYEVFMEDISVVTSLHCQVSIIDIPRLAANQIPSIWPQLLSVRCRQRLLLCHPGLEIDARKLLHFLVPELFSSRRKLLAWNSAAFPPEHVCTLCDIVKSFTVLSSDDASTAFTLKVKACTVQNCEREMAALDFLNRQGIVRPIQPSIMMPVKRILNRKFRSRACRHIPAKGRIDLQKPALEPTNPHLTIKASSIHSRKRSGNDGTPGSRQRIGRCGKCTGCLAEDCMKCGHCQDMKKYGGPGLRKQSCKHRKCLNPKIWGLASRKRKRKTKRVGEMNNAKGNVELDGEASAAYSSVESDGESVLTAANANLGSDDDSLRYSDAAVDSPRDLLLPASDTFLNDHRSLSDLSSRSASARTRVVRCGDCQGCLAPDCMKCPHCLDMKKYGGPGLRKQTCKSRKCHAPKIVMLNQAKAGHDQYVDEMGNVVYSGQSDGTLPGFCEISDSSDRPEFPISISTRFNYQSVVPSVIQECERYVKPRLIFACLDCAARFSSSKVLNFHVKVEHPPSLGHRVLAPTALEKEASQLFLRPVYQNAMICAQLKQEDRDAHAFSPQGYAKLEGQSFQYYFVKPLVVLGRMNFSWCKLYKDMGFSNLKGIPGGDVDCHIGNDSTIASRHAVISWDACLGSFVIECLSLRTSISVNGREISFSSPPMILRSRNLVQIGACVFYFLLPKTRCASEAC